MLIQQIKRKLKNNIKAEKINRTISQYLYLKQLYLMASILIYLLMILQVLLKQYYYHKYQFLDVIIGICFQNVQYKLFHCSSPKTNNFVYPMVLPSATIRMEQIFFEQDQMNAIWALSEPKSMTAGCAPSSAVQCDRIHCLDQKEPPKRIG